MLILPKNGYFKIYNFKTLAPKNTKKMIFSKNLNSVISPNIGGGSHNGPGHLGTIRPQYTIQKLTILLWPSVGMTYFCDSSIFGFISNYFDTFIFEHTVLISIGWNWTLDLLNVHNVLSI